MKIRIEVLIESLWNVKDVISPLQTIKRQLLVVGVKVHICTNCTHFTVAEMSVMKNQALGAIWFCVDCQKPAWKSVKIDKEIDERCQEYFDKMEQRLDELEKKVDKKADDSELQAVSKSLTDTRNQVKLDTAELEQLKKDFKTFEKGEKVQSAIQDAVESEVREWRE